MKYPQWQLGERQKSRNIKKKLDRTGIDKEGSLEWLSRGQINWDGEGVIINAQDQGHYMSVFNKMAGLSQSAKCRFCGVETESTSQLLSGCKKYHGGTVVHIKTREHLQSNPLTHLWAFQHPGPRTIMETQTKSDPWWWRNNANVWQDDPVKCGHCKRSTASGHRARTQKEKVSIVDQGVSSQWLWTKCNKIQENNQIPGSEKWGQEDSKIEESWNCINDSRSDRNDEENPHWVFKNHSEEHHSKGAQVEVVRGSFAPEKVNKIISTLDSNSANGPTASAHVP